LGSILTISASGEEVFTLGWRDGSEEIRKARPDASTVRAASVLDIDVNRRRALIK